MFEDRPWPGGHVPEEQLLSTALSARAQMHLDSCPQCRMLRLILQNKTYESSNTFSTVQQPSLVNRASLSSAEAVSEVIKARPQDLVRLVVQLVSELSRFHDLCGFHGGLQVQPNVNAEGRTTLPLRGSQGSISDDWVALGSWLRRWVVSSPSRMLAALADELAEGSLNEQVGLRMLELIQQFLDTDHYQDVGLLGRGGQGEVRRVLDRRLQRMVALKTAHSGGRERFLYEATVTARLQHPGIVPVYELGRLPDGRDFYTMEITGGRTLKEAIRRLHQPNNEVVPGEETTQKRLISALVSVCDSMAYAHSQGVLHRDLKPSNIMLGDFGEVRVLDWGLAGVHREKAPSGEVGHGTCVGEVFGTPAYMAPEQARGESVGPGADVYALGVILLELLVGVPPFEGFSPKQIIAALKRGERPAVPLDCGPQALVTLVETCLSDDRPTAAKVASELRDWLDGVQAKVRAEQAVCSVQGFEEQAAGQRALAKEMLQSAETKLAELPGNAPVTQKISAWREQKQAHGLKVQAAVLDAQLEQGLRAALHHFPEYIPALEQIAALYKNRLIEAERSGQVEEMARVRTLLSEHAGGRYRSWVVGDGRLTLVTHPPGAKVYLEEFVEVDRRLTLQKRRLIGTSPLVEEPLARGSYQLTLIKEGFEPVIYPILIERGELWEPRPPGQESLQPVWLPPLSALTPGERYVPAGWFIAGGDSLAPDSLSRRKLWCDGFVIHRDPVSVGEYFQFLNTQLQAGNPDLATLLPQVRYAGGRSHSTLYRLSQGVYEPVFEEYYGEKSETMPMVGVSYQAASAYVNALGGGWALPHALQWEKAARGVDGRLFVSGAYLDPTWTQMSTSRDGRPLIVLPSSLDHDVSVYGVRGLMGNVRDYCHNGYDREGVFGKVRDEPASQNEARVVKGGSWQSPLDYCRPANRLVANPVEGKTGIGFRPIRWV